MNPKFLWVFLVFAAVSCSRSGKMHRDQQKYEVVQEGSASGVTSTINAPGESELPQPVTSSAITGTNVDTTTAFTLPGTATAATTTQPRGTVAGTFPATTTRPRIQRPRLPSNPPMDSSTETATPPTTTDTVATPKSTDKTSTQG